MIDGCVFSRPLYVYFLLLLVVKFGEKTLNRCVRRDLFWVKAFSLKANVVASTFPATWLPAPRPLTYLRPDKKEISNLINYLNWSLWHINQKTMSCQSLISASAVWCALSECHRNVSIGGWAVCPATGGSVIIADAGRSMAPDSRTPRSPICLGPRELHLGRRRPTRNSYSRNLRLLYLFCLSLLCRAIPKRGTGHEDNQF